jgi:membrane protein involved in colicin uptake
MVKTLGTSLAWEGRVIPGVPRERQVLQEREPPPARREVSNPEGRAVRAGDRRGALAEVRVAREEAREVVAEARVAREEARAAAAEVREAREEARAAAAEVREAREEAREVVAEVPVDLESRMVR